MYQNIPTKVLTCEVRLSYVNLVQPKTNDLNPGEEPKYSVTLLIPKTEVNCKKDIDASIEAAAKMAEKKLWGGKRPPVMAIPIHDGDGVRRNGTAFGDECREHWIITAKTKTKPQVVHQSNVRVELAPQDIYSGMYGRVTINFYGYDFRGNRGIGCGLGNVMKTREGEPLTGVTSAATDFADLEIVTEPGNGNYLPF